MGNSGAHFLKVHRKATLKAVIGRQGADLDAAVGALRVFSSGLEVDGYSMEVSAGAPEGLLVVKIVAGPDACEDCLIPKEMFTGMLASRLSSQGVEFSDLSLVYPND